MLIECPHCHVRVAPSHDGAMCPSCHQSVNELNGINPNRALLLIRSTARMPELCSQCGIPTSRFARIEAEQYDAAPLFGWMSSRLLKPLIAIVNRLRRLAQSGRIVIEVPLCEFCSDKTVNSFAIHPAGDVIQCQVHADFKLRYQQLNQR